MAIIYTNINNGISTGDGTSANPFNVQQMQSFIQGNVVSGISAIDDDVIKCKGSHVFDNPNFYDPFYKWKNTLTIQSWEDGIFWTLSADGTSLYINPSEFSVENDKTLDIKNGVLNNVVCSEYGADLSITGTNINLKNCIIYDNFNVQYISSGVNVKAYGCTFISADSLLDEYVTSSNNNVIVYNDCCFINSLIDDDNDNFGSISAFNCIFTDNESTVSAYVSATSTSGSVLFSGCEYSWDQGGQTFPAFLDIDKNNIRFSDYNLSSTSASRQAFWQTNDYNIGFWNYDRQGAGAFNFAFPEVADFSATPVSGVTSATVVFTDLSTGTGLSA